MQKLLYFESLDIYFYLRTLMGNSLFYFKYFLYSFTTLYGVISLLIFTISA